jgi:integrase/recombinase XerD
MDATQILTRGEITQVLRDLSYRARTYDRRKNHQTLQNLILFRLSTCCGLRVSECSGINLGDVLVAGPRPVVRIRKSVGKRKKARKIPLWWDKGTLKDLSSWKAIREAEGAGPDDPFICGRGKNLGKRLTRVLLYKRWKTSIRRLGKERVAQLHIHCGRHSFCSHALAAGRSLVEVRDAAGHDSIATTNIYLHVVGLGDGVPDIFSYKEADDA